ncbi:peptide chain release factor N(5)-glutamine methyltransferase [Oxalobacteraceae bacterium CAVE-383]|nr:peptide chain release factor N(5)-glutamine methyltransferase [Oxalobacteraceae bacterium CAVE-383]
MVADLVPAAGAEPRPRGTQAPLNAASIAALQRQSPLDALETRILLSHVTGLSRMQLITHDEQVLTPAQSETLQQLIRRRQQGEPIAYLTGQREFYGLMLRVTPDVLIPRPETELLVELALARLPAGGRVLDMGTGSGAIAVAIAHERPDAEVTALDVSPAALAVAAENAGRRMSPIRFIESDWYRALGEQPAQNEPQSFDVIVANPPYIVAGDTHLAQGDLRFEPVNALTDHGDGLSALRTIIAGAPAHLRAGGWLLMEHGYDQAAAVRELLELQGFREVRSWRDLAGIERVSGGHLHP